MTSALCSDPRHHAAFGYHQRTVEGTYCTVCRALPPAPSQGGSREEEGAEVNLPSLTTPTPPDPIVDTPGLDASRGAKLPPGPLPAPDRPRKHQRRCPYCGAAFTPRRNDTIWCSANCRKNSYSRRRYARDRVLNGQPYHPRLPMRDRTPFRLLLEREDEA